MHYSGNRFTLTVEIGDNLLTLWTSDDSGSERICSSLPALNRNPDHQDFYRALSERIDQIVAGGGQVVYVNLPADEG